MISIDLGCLASDIASFEVMIDLAIEFRAGQRARMDTGRDHDRLGGQLFVADLDLIAAR